MTPVVEALQKELQHMVEAYNGLTKSYIVFKNKYNRESEDFEKMLEWYEIRMGKIAELMDLLNEE